MLDVLSIKRVVEEQVVMTDRIKELKRLLSDSDYKIIKSYEYSLVGQEPPYDVALLHTERQAIRDEINQLETSMVKFDVSFLKEFIKERKTEHDSD